MFCQRYLILNRYYSENYFCQGKIDFVYRANYLRQKKHSAILRHLLNVDLEGVCYHHESLPRSVSYARIKYTNIVDRNAQSRT